MRIINVTVSAFGSYQGEVAFPLEELGAEGLYLIYGNTGSGKTTLFDAVCFGLFGKASGAYRQPKEMRCEYANPKTDTKVVITFEVYGKRYKVSRWYLMDRERTTVKDSKAKLEFLHLENGETVPTLIKKGEVDDFVEDLLKVDYKQFKQIAMIAQGEFQQVLLTSTSDRSDIFTTMFQTQQYSKIQDEIKEDFERTEANEKENESLIEQNLGRLELFGGESEQEQTLLEELKEKKVKLELSGEELSALVLSQKNALSQVDQKKKEAELGLKETEEYFNKLSTVEVLLSQKTQAENKLSLQEQVLEEAQENLEKTADYKEKVEAIQATLVKIKDLMGLCLAVEEEERDASALALEVKALELEEERSVSLKEAKETEEKEGREWLETHEKLGEEILALRQKVDAEKLAMDSLDELEGNLRAMNTKEAEKNTLESKYETVKKKWDELHQGYKRQMSLFLDEQAGILAENLREGEPCLVCGSTTHPQPAQKGTSTCTSEELDEIREKVEKKEKEVQKVAEQLGERKNELSALVGGVQTQSQTLLQTEDLEEIAEKLSQKRQESTLSIDETKLKELEVLEVEKGKKEETQKEILQKKEEIAQDIQRISGEKEKQNGILSEKRSKLEKEHGKLEGQTVAKLTLEAKTLEGEKAEKESKRAQAEKTLSEAKEGLATCKGALDGVVKSLENTDASQELFEKKAEFQEKEGMFKATIAALEGQEKKLLTVVSNNEKIHKEVVSLLEKRVGILEEQKWLKPLNQAANGKVKLQTFVQSYYFDLVLAEANLVYSRMNNNKYLMLRDEEKDKNSAVGLGVKVYEQDTGKIRRARTLSGGESFQASLALALGFSQAVAQEAQSSPIQSLFLDEGFGSLDGDTLQEAIGTLLDLAEEGRMIGLISHVEELKNAISKRILVEKTPRGSKVTFQGIDSSASKTSAD